MPNCIICVIEGCAKCAKIGTCRCRIGLESGNARICVICRDLTRWTQTSTACVYFQQQTYHVMVFAIVYRLNIASGTKKLLTKSEVAVKSDHVLKSVYDSTNDHVQGRVQASMRDRCHHVNVSTNLTIYILDTAFSRWSKQTSSQSLS